MTRGARRSRDLERELPGPLPDAEAAASSSVCATPRTLEREQLLAIQRGVGNAVVARYLGSGERRGLGRSDDVPSRRHEAVVSQRAARIARVAKPEVVVARTKAPPGYRRQAQVNVGYYPMHTTKPTSLRSGPGTGFAEIVQLHDRTEVGRASVRNSEADSDPPARPLENWFAWVYLASGSHPGKSGWLDWHALGHGAKVEVDGPATDDKTGKGLDFEVGRGHPHKKAKSKKVIGAPTSGYRYLKKNDTYLRYAATSSAFAYLAHNDKVALLWRHPKAGAASHFMVKVVASKNVAAGVVGWIDDPAANLSHTKTHP